MSKQQVQVTDENQEQPEETLTLREEIIKQLDQGKEEDAPQEEVEDEAEEVAEEESTEEQEAVSEEELPEDNEEVDDNIPNNWNEEEKKAFLDIPDEIIAQDGTEISLKAMKDVVLNRNETLLKAFNEKAREAADVKKGSEEWNKLLDPYKPQLEATGLSEQQWIGNILQAVHNLQNNPQAVIKDLIDTYKVSAKDLGFTQQSDEEDYLFEDNSDIAQLKSTIDKLTRRLDSQEQASVQQQNQSVQDQLNAFRDEKDANGNLLHPYFDEARVEMGVLVQAGKAKTFQEAYDNSPTVKLKNLEPRKDPEADKLALQKAREEAAKAKKAGKTVKTRSGQTSTLGNVSMREELRLRLSGAQ